jgi:hypothetical protein
MESLSSAGVVSPRGTSLVYLSIMPRPLLPHCSIELARDDVFEV